jgi:hypothetical protein
LEKINIVVPAAELQLKVTSVAQRQIAQNPFDQRQDIIIPDMEGRPYNPRGGMRIRIWKVASCNPRGGMRIRIWKVAPCNPRGGMRFFFLTSISIAEFWTVYYYVISYL